MVDLFGLDHLWACTSAKIFRVRQSQLAALVSIERASGVYLGTRGRGLPPNNLNISQGQRNTLIVSRDCSGASSFLGTMSTRAQRIDLEALSTRGLLGLSWRSNRHDLEKIETKSNKLYGGESCSRNWWDIL